MQQLSRCGILDRESQKKVARMEMDESGDGDEGGGGNEGGDRREWRWE